MPWYSATCSAGSGSSFSTTTSGYATRAISARPPGCSTPMSLSGWASGASPTTRWSATPSVTSADGRRHSSAAAPLPSRLRRTSRSFPVYNEDWFFLLDSGKRLQSVASVGQVLQYPYDPYRVERARAEEFGDVVAEGIFWLLDQGKPGSDGDLEHWRNFLEHRKEFIRQVRSMVASQGRIDSAERTRMQEALTAALGRCERIDPELCVAYMKALAADQDRWQRHIEQVRRQPVPSLEKALRVADGRWRGATDLAPRGGSPRRGARHQRTPIARCARACLALQRPGYRLRRHRDPFAPRSVKTQCFARCAGICPRHRFSCDSATAGGVCARGKS